MTEKIICRKCGSDISNQVGSGNVQCCLYQKIFSNFTGEFNSWDEIVKELDLLLTDN